jgi:uroporphyrinogen decarboxylase
LNKIERVMKALRAEDVDRPPFGFWYHFGLQHLPGRKHAEAEVDFFRAYDPDFLKVMNDYPYPLPDGVEAVEAEEDWKRIAPVAGNDPCWAEQLTALSIISEEIGAEALFIETIFCPWTTARRLAPSGALQRARERFPETLLEAMENISASLALYAKEAVERGASGIFLSLSAASDDVMTQEEYRVWGRPFDLKILEAVKDAPFNVLHIHGKRIHFDSLLDFPATALNWSHATTAPSLKEGRAGSGKTVMGGIDETTAAHLSALEMREQVIETVAEMGVRGLIIAPGCSVPTDTPARNLRAVGEALTK